MSRVSNIRGQGPYAAGAGDNTAGYCLYLHHLARSETKAADQWRTQTRIDTTPTAYTVMLPSSHDLIDAVPISSGTTTILRILRGLGDAPRWTAMVSDITTYVLSAVPAAHRDDLPVPEDFAEDLRHVLADAAARDTCGPSCHCAQPPDVLVGRWLNP